MNPASNPQPTDWHRRPEEGGPHCPICDIPGRTPGEHRRLRPDEETDYVWEKRKKSPTGWQFSRVGSRQPVVRKPFRRKPKPLEVTGSPGSLAVYFYRCFLPDQLRGNAPTTVRSYVKAVTKFCVWAEHDIAMAEVNEGLIAQFIESLAADGLSAETYNLHRACLRRIVRHARPGECLKRRGKRPHELEAVGMNDDALAVEGSLLKFFREVYVPERMVGVSPESKNTTSIRKLSQCLGRPAMLTDLTDETIAGFLAWMLEQGLSRATANSKRAQILSPWRYAYRKKLVDKLPDVDKLKEHRRLPVAWTIPEMEKLLAACASKPGMVNDIPAGRWWLALVLVLFDTGIRRRAALSIERDDLDLETSWLVVPAENQKQATEQRFLLSDQTIEAIRRVWEPPRRLLFDWPLSNSRLWKHYGKIVNAAGLPNGRKAKFHKLRKTCASHIAKAAGIDAASRQLGHSGEYVTKLYVDPTIARSAVDGVVHLPRPKLNGQNGGASHEG